LRCRNIKRFKEIVPKKKKEKKKKKKKKKKRTR